MNQFAHALWITFLLLALQDSATTPSVADAARAARERQKSASSKHVLSDDDLRRAGHPAPSQALESPDEIRDAMRRTYPLAPTAADLKRDVDQMTNYSKCCSVEEMYAKSHDAALHNQESVDFPGKKDWEEGLRIATRKFVEEAGTTARNLQAILDENQNAFSPGSATALQEIRSQWIETKIPFTQWSDQLTRLTEEGRLRASGHLQENPEALAAYRRSRSADAETSAGLALLRFNQDQSEYKRSHGRYTCDPIELGMDLSSADGRNSAKREWMFALDTMHYHSYQFRLQSCSEGSYLALAIPPAADGSEGRAMCSTDKAMILVAADGQSSQCLSTGRKWELH